MVTRFSIKYYNFKNSYDGIVDAINDDDNSTKNIKACLYDFSACIEQLWKLMKYILEYAHGVQNINGSKDAFRAFNKSAYIDEEDVNELFKMYDLRNRLAHEYESTNFEEYFEHINNFSKLLNKLDTKFQEIGEMFSSEFAKDIIA